MNLLLPEWAESVHPTDINESEMDPWLNVATEPEFLESITAQIIST